MKHPGTSDTSEQGLEALIVRAMTGRTDVLSPEHVTTETSVPVAGGTGWLLGDATHYDREYGVDLVHSHVSEPALRALIHPFVPPLRVRGEGDRA